MNPPDRVPPRAYAVLAAGLAVNLCLGMLYAWSIWSAELVGPEGTTPGDSMPGINEGWHYLSNSQWPYAICGFVFALTMIPGGKLQDRYGPRTGATLAGLCLGGGCILAGLMKSQLGLILGYGFLGGIGMGFGYAAATPAVVRWFGPHRRGLVVGLVVGGYGAASIYIAPLAKRLIAAHGLTGSFVGLGLFFAAVILVAAQFLRMPPEGYVAPKPKAGSATPKPMSRDRSAGEMLSTWQFFALVFLFAGSAQAGLLVIANAAPFLKKTASGVAFFAANAWILVSYGGLVNASGRVGTGFYSDAVGRSNAFTLNGLAAAACMFALPSVMADGQVGWLFLLVGIVYWQYGGTLSLLPAWTADFFGPKNLGLNYGLVFFGWGVAFGIPLIAESFKLPNRRLDDSAFYLSGGLLLAAVMLSRVLKRPN